MPTETSIGVQLITYLLLPGLSALLGAWAGAKTALARFRQERSFDRRVEWLERSIRTIGELRHTYTEVFEDSRTGNLQSLKDTAQRAVQLNRQLVLHLYESEMYAGPIAVRLAATLRQQLQFLQAPPPPVPSATLPSMEAKVQNEMKAIEPGFKALEPGLSQLVEALVSDIRHHLGLEPLG